MEIARPDGRVCFRRGSVRLAFFGRDVAVAVLVAAAAGGCARPARDRSIAVPPPALPELARAQHDGEVIVRDGKETVHVRSGNDAQVKLDVRPCHNPVESSSRDCHGYTVPLAELRFARDGSVCRGRCGDPSLQDRLPDITRASLRLYHYVDPGWRPTFGIGAAVMGPATLVAVDAQWLPVDELALEVGATPMPGLLGGYAGFRLRASGAGRLAPWLGGFTAGVCAFGEGVRSAGVGCAAAVAGRLGVDWSLYSGTFLVSPEVDVLHPVHGYFDIHWPLTPWGGVTLSWMY